MTDAPDYGSPLFAALRDAAAEPWAAYVRHPFVAGLGDGSLPRACFLHYLRQDYVFLVHFSRAWALVAAKSGRLEEMRPAATVLDALINHEMALHVAKCAEAGISEAELAATEEAPENLAYTRYVLETGHAGDVLDLLVALAPCVLGYGEIGRRLAAEAAPGGPYADWIATYGGAEYQGVCETMGGLLETAAAARIGPALDASPRAAALRGIFATATRLEGAFWAMGLRGR